MTEHQNGKTKNSFLSGVALLTASAAAVKLIGVFYKLPLVALVGIEGMAYFLAAYHIYTLLFMISTAGLPVAVSILVSRRLAQNDENGAGGVLFAALKLFSLIGTVFFIGMVLFSDIIAASIKIPEAALSVRAIAPALLFTALSSAVRGYFQGCGIMYPTAVSQIIEAVGKLGLGLLFSTVGIRLGAELHTVAALAIAGISAGSLLSCIYLFYLMQRKIQRVRSKKRDTGRTLFEILKIAAPITLGAAVISLTGVIDTALVSSRLQDAGFSSAEANSMYSSYGNLAVPIFGLIPSFISPVAVTAAPLLADAVSRGDKEKEKSIFLCAVRLCALIAVPACFGIAMLSEPILMLLYPSQPDAVRLAASMLSALAPAIFFSCMITVTNSVLQAYGKERLPVVSMLFGVAVKTALEYFLLGRADVNILGAPISTLICDLSIVCINIFFVQKYSCGAKGLTGAVLRPMSASLLPTAAALITYILMTGHGISGTAALFAAMALDIFLYTVFAAWNGSVNEEDLLFLPHGEKLIIIMKKIRLLRNDNEQGRKNNLTQSKRKI